MFGFGKKAHALRILDESFMLSKGEVFTPMLSLYLGSSHNAHDAAFSYVLARSRSIGLGDANTECFLEWQLQTVEEMADEAADPTDVRRLVQQALDYRRELANGWFPTFEHWLVRFKDKCGSINAALRTNDAGSSLIDFMDQSGLKQAFADKLDPEDLAEKFAPTFHPETFGRTS